MTEARSRTSFYLWTAAARYSSDWCCWPSAAALSAATFRIVVEFLGFERWVAGVGTLAHGLHPGGDDP
jgi:hypothetical protein